MPTLVPTDRLNCPKIAEDFRMLLESLKSFPIIFQSIKRSAGWLASWLEKLVSWKMLADWFMNIRVSWLAAGQGWAAEITAIFLSAHCKINRTESKQYKTSLFSGLDRFVLLFIRLP